MPLAWKKSAWYGLVAVGAIATAGLLWIAALTFLPPSVIYMGEISQARRYIAELESYKEKTGSYPDEKTQTIVPRLEATHIFYRGGGSVYTLVLSVGFDETYYYDSSTRKWSFDR